VQETMQPTHVFLWLPKPTQPVKYEAQACHSDDVVPEHGE